MEAINAAGCLRHDGYGRWSLDLAGLLKIEKGLVAVAPSGRSPSISDEWRFVGATTQEETDNIGKLKSVVLSYQLEDPSLRVNWFGGAYENEPAFAISMEVQNLGGDDVFLDALVPLYAMGDRGAVVVPLCGKASDWILLNQSKWMSDQKEPWSSLDPRQLVLAYHSSALCHGPTGKGVVVGIGESSNTVARIGAGLRGPGFDLQVAGEMSVNRHGRPYRLKAGAKFRMNRIMLLGGLEVNAALTAYADYVRKYLGFELRHRPYTGVFSAYGQDLLDRKNYCAYPLTDRRISEIMDVLEKYVKPYGLEYIKTQFGGLSSGPGETIYSRREWTQAPIQPMASTGDELAGIIREKGFTPDTFDLAKHHPGGVKALSDMVHARGFKHALVCRPYLNVESGPPEWDEMAADIFRMAVKDWGYDYLMFDFVSADFENDYDDSRTMAEAIRDRFQKIRDAVGPDVFIEACMMMPGPVIGIADGFRPASDWRAGIEPELVSQLASRFYYHDRLFQLDLEFFHPSLTPFTWEGQGPDKGRRFFGSLERVRTWVSFSGLSGYSYLTGGIVEQVSEERWHLFNRAMPVYGKPARPVDLLTTKRPGIWVLDAELVGRPYRAIGLFNWNANDNLKLKVCFADCGLEAEKSYTLFDFWAQKMLGIFSGQFETILPPSGCQVLFVNELDEQPRIIGTDRHVTGAIGLKEFNYCADTMEIDGISEGPAATSIRHYIHVPFGQGPQEVEGGCCEVAQPGVLRMEIRLPDDGQQLAVRAWKIKLARNRVTI